jgi:cyclase
MRSDHYRFEQIAHGVWTAMALQAGGGVSNACIADLEGRSLVVDCGFTPGAAHDLRAAAEELAGPVERLVITHGDFDHYGGSTVFADLPILATETTRAAIAANGPARAAALQSELEAERAAMEERNAPEWEWEQIRRIAEQLPFDLALPTETYEGERDLGGAVVIDCGAAHTASDAIVWLPGARVLFAGDLVTPGNHSNLTRGHPPEGWLRALDRMTALQPEHVFGGHGPAAGPEAISDARGYVEAVVAAADGPDEPEVPPAFAAWEYPELFAQNVIALSSRSAGRQSPPAR